MAVTLPLRAILLAALLIAPALPALCNAIQWNSATLGTTDADSSGTPLDDSWSFHLGAFTDPSSGGTGGTGGCVDPPLR